MIYNAMKLFMEVNPTLFDECSHDWSESNTSKAEREQTRQSKWERLAEQGKARKLAEGGQVDSKPMPLPMTTGFGTKVLTPPARLDGAGDPFGHDKLGMLKDLQIQEASIPGRLGQP